MAELLENVILLLLEWGKWESKSLLLKYIKVYSIYWMIYLLINWIWVIYLLKLIIFIR